MNTPRPDHRHIYLLIAGLLAGILLGPGVLGRINPGLYERAFVGAGNIENRLAQLQQKHAGILAQLHEQKADDVAVNVLEQKFNDELSVEMALYKAHTQRALAQWQLWLSALVLALALIMVMEPFVTQPLELQQALLWGRYTLMAIWAAMLLAQPALFRGLPLSMVLAFLALAVGTGLPLKKLFEKPQNEKSNDPTP